ncbi:unnamed protein product [Prorocentrum cordatum]|uniref:Apple domain-containing protein n=1 Tax=Prorocentrum cordatum TaxID=2364126 RepID=A0ABN9V6C8_9DINO|nr:unnamed protein product [Polarella glacialis]
MSWGAALLAALSAASLPAAIQVNPPAGGAGDRPAPPYRTAAADHATKPVVVLARRPPAKKAPAASAEELAERAEEEKVAGEAWRRELEQKESQALDAIERMVSQADIRGKLPAPARASALETEGHDDKLVSPLFRLKGDSRQDYWCDDTAGEPMFEGTVSDSLACEEKCGANLKCGFFSFFEGDKYCLLSEECGEMSPSSRGHVKVFAKAEGGGASAPRDDAGEGEAADYGPHSGSTPRSRGGRTEEDRLLHNVASRYLDRTDDFYDAEATFKAGHQPRGPIVDIDAGILQRIVGFVVDQLQGGAGPEGARREVGLLQSVTRTLTAALAEQPADAKVTQLGARIGGAEEEDGLGPHAGGAGGAGGLAERRAELEGGGPAREAEFQPHPAAGAEHEAGQAFQKVKSIGQALGAAELVPRLSEAVWGQLGAVWAEASEGVVVAGREPEIAAALLELAGALTEGQLPHGRSGAPQRTRAGRALQLDTLARAPEGLAP